jgi:hypothetical protein
MSHYSGNFGRQFLNGRQLTSDMKKSQLTYEYGANAVLPMNVGFEQFAVGQFNPALELNAYLRTGTGTTTLHDYLAYTYNGIGAAGDVEILFTDVFGLDAEPAIGNPATAGVFTLTNYPIPRDTSSVFMANPTFAARGIHFPMCWVADYAVNTSAFSSSPVTSSPYYDSGADDATAATAGAFMAFHWISADGTGTVQVELQSCATTGGTYVTFGTASCTLASNIGWGYVLIPSVANGGTTINRYKKVKYTLSATPQTGVTFCVVWGRFNP